MAIVSPGSNPERVPYQTTARNGSVGESEGVVSQGSPFGPSGRG